jgi:hypothetical protein
MTRTDNSGGSTAIFAQKSPCAAGVFCSISWFGAGAPQDRKINRSTGLVAAGGRAELFLTAAQVAGEQLATRGALLRPVAIWLI